MTSLIQKLFSSPILFPKKKGEAQRRASPFVAEVYGPEYVGNVTGNTKPPAVGGKRAAACGKFFHITYHSFPDSARNFRVCVVLVMALAWTALYPLDVKLRCMIISSIYSVTESIFTLFERGAPYTSAAQFAANLVYTSVLLDVYGRFFAHDVYLYVVLFPINIWVLEVVVGTIIVAIYGHNVAWCYLDYTDAYCWGHIRVGHGVWWLLLGLQCYVCYPPLQAWTAGLTFEY